MSPPTTLGLHKHWLSVNIKGCLNYLFFWKVEQVFHHIACMKPILAHMVCHLVFIFSAFNLPLCSFQTLKEFISVAESEAASVTSLYSVVVISLTIFLVYYAQVKRDIKIVLLVCGQGRNADALALYFGENPACFPFEQGRLSIFTCCWYDISHCLSTGVGALIFSRL